MYEQLMINFDYIVMLLVSIILGGIIGFERKLSGKDPGLKTFSLICMGSCLFTIASELATQGAQMADPGRVAAQIASGVGFLGAGAIFKSGNHITGLTTAAYMWFTAAIGMLAGLGECFLAITAVALSLIMILFYRFLVKVTIYRDQVSRNRKKSET